MVSSVSSATLFALLAGTAVTGTASAPVRGSGLRAPRSLSDETASYLTPTLAPSSTYDSGEQVCFQGFTNEAEERLVRMIVDELTGRSALLGASSMSDFPVVTQSVVGVPEYAVGCSILNFKCMECSLCTSAYGALIKTGTTAACDAACVGIVEAIGGGPEDPIADIVAAACVPLCSAIFSSQFPTAQSACSAAHLC